MAICAMLQCNSSNDKRLKRNQDECVRNSVKFFKFPKDKLYARQWLQKCKRSYKVNINNAYVCSKHFKPEHYLRNLQHELLNYSPRSCRKLKLDAIPTENLPIGSVKYEVKETVRQKRQVRKINTQIVNNMLKSASENLVQPDSIEVVENEENTETIIRTCVDKITSTDSLTESITNTANLEMLKLKAKIKELQKKNHFLKKENDGIADIFTPTQRNKMRNKGNRIRWTVDDISRSIVIYANGPKAYRFLLKQKYPLPAVSTLKCCIEATQNIKCRDG